MAAASRQRIHSPHIYDPPCCSLFVRGASVQAEVAELVPPQPADFDAGDAGEDKEQLQRLLLLHLAGCKPIPVVQSAVQLTCCRLLSDRVTSLRKLHKGAMS